MVHTEAMRRLDGGLVLKAADELSIGRPHTDASAAALFGDVDGVVRGDGHVARHHDIGPLLDEDAVGIEHLDAVVLTVADDDAARLEGSNGESNGDLARGKDGRKGLMDIDGMRSLVT